MYELMNICMYVCIHVYMYDGMYVLIYVYSGKNTNILYSTPELNMLIIINIGTSTVVPKSNIIRRHFVKIHFDL